MRTSLTSPLIPKPGADLTDTTTRCSLDSPLTPLQGADFTEKSADSTKKKRIITRTLKLIVLCGQKHSGQPRPITTVCTQSTFRAGEISSKSDARSQNKLSKR
ncbi:hypothetical protein PoB_002009200 [Plakobranchus ocellatus]|uniref:Uncharacterized protein n=1 Tax=Plakobranchus ocellatus TaxID=259542 RepID=A0AAV3ZE80_9GAST|nr:hypothetical protein PoB_002009200 [Plakobranchus ocellatus]